MTIESGSPLTSGQVADLQGNAREHHQTFGTGSVPLDAAVAAINVATYLTDFVLKKTEGNIGKILFVRPIEVFSYPWRKAGTILLDRIAPDQNRKQFDFLDIP